VIDQVDQQCAALDRALTSVGFYDETLDASFESLGGQPWFSAATRDQQLTLLARLRVMYAEVFGVEALISLDR
jgi:hypothetical protein